MLRHPCTILGSCAGALNLLLSVAAGDPPSVVISLSTIVAVLAGGVVWALRKVMTDQASRLDAICKTLQAQQKLLQEIQRQSGNRDWIQG